MQSSLKYKTCSCKGILVDKLVNDGEYVITNVVYDLDDSFDVCSDNKYEILGTK